MRKFVLTAIIIMITIIFLSNIQVYACSSFAVYSKDNTLYGMNFDYPDTEVMIKTFQKSNLKVFSMSFRSGSEDGKFSPTVVYNSNGLFINTQMQFPEAKGKNTPGKGECFFDEVEKYIYGAGDTNGIKKFLNSKRIVQYTSPTLHSLIADKNGNAMIVETGDKNNEILPINNKFIVMTNFRNSDFKNVAYSNVEGTGADRYQAAYEYIEKNINKFDIDNGMEVLNKTRQASGGFPTQCTMLFNPRNNEIFISFKNDFNKVWKINLNKSTIETYKGFNKYHKIRLTSKGITAAELQNLKSDNNKTSSMVKILSMVLFIGLIILILIAFKKKR